MSTPEPSAPPSRQTRTIVWMAGLLVGTCAHITWWTTVGPGKCEAPAAAPTIEVHIHHTPPDAAELSDHSDRGPRITGVLTDHADHHRARRERRRRHAKRRHHRERRREHARAAASSAPNGAIVCTTDGCTVRRSFVQRLITDPAVRPDGRLVPRVEHGQITGLRVFGMKPGSIGTILGLKNGDTLLALDDTPFRNGPALVAHASALPQADRFTLTVQRGADTLSLQYEIIDE